MAGRFEREIEEILESSEVTPEPPKSRKGGRGPSQGARSRLDGLRDNLSPGRVFLASVALLLSALIVRSLSPGVMVSILFWIGLVLFIAAYALFFVRSGSRTETRWRGQPVSYTTRPTWWRRFRDWIRG